MLRPDHGFYTTLMIRTFLFISVLLAVSLNVFAVGTDKPKIIRAVAAEACGSDFELLPFASFRFFGLVVFLICNLDCRDIKF